MERASRRWVDGLAGSPESGTWVVSGPGTDASRLRVYGCTGAAHTSSAGPELDDAAEVHHRDAVGDDARRREVVGDEQHRHAELAPEPPDEVQRGGRERHVERARRLVAQQQRRRHDDRPGERGALALAARELRGLRLGDLGGEADERERLGNPLAARVAADALVVQALADELADRHPRRERRARVLEHDLGPGALADDHLAVVVRQQAGDDAQQRRLAAARLADERDRPAAHDLEVDAAQGLELLPPPPAAQRERLGDALDHEGRVRRAAVVGEGRLLARPVGRGRGHREPAVLTEADARGDAVVRTGRAQFRWTAATQPSTRSAHRGANAQPGGWARGSGGSPGSVGS